MSVLSSYRRLFALTGPLYVVVAFVARLPMAMSQMGILLLVAEVSGSYGGGGAAAGAFAVVNALASPLAGALTDRIGQRPVLLVQSVGGALALLALVVLSRQDVPWQLLAVVSGVAGVFVPQVGTLARVRWRELTRAKGGQGFKLLSTAFSYEGAADEASFVLGPAIVGTTAAVVSPAGALLLAAGGLAVFATWFALHPTVALVRGHRGVRDGAGGRVGPLLLGLAAGQLLVGAIFGSVQAGTTALASRGWRACSTPSWASAASWPASPSSCCRSASGSLTGCPSSPAGSPCSPCRCSPSTPSARSPPSSSSWAWPSRPT